jgi:hypothetical protein
MLANEINPRVEVLAATTDGTTQALHFAFSGCGDCDAMCFQCTDHPPGQVDVNQDYNWVTIGQFEALSSDVSVELHGANIDILDIRSVSVITPICSIARPIGAPRSSSH